jgi:hypothetical protein
MGDVWVGQMVTVMYVVKMTNYIIMGQRNGQFGVLDLSVDFPKVIFHGQFEGLEKSKVNDICRGERPREVMMGTNSGLVFVEFSKGYDKVMK